MRRTFARLEVESIQRAAFTPHLKCTNLSFLNMNMQSVPGIRAVTRAS